MQSVPGDGKPAAPASQSTESAGTKPAGEKPAAEKPAAESKPKDGEKPTAKAPEKYEFALPKGMPEGHTLDEAVISDFSAVAKELDLSQEQAQKLLDKVMPTIHRRGLESTKAMHEDWVKELRADKVFGGEKLLEAQKVAQNAIDFFDKEGRLHGLLTGPLRLGDNPAFFAFAHAVGQAMKSDRFVGSDRPPVSAGSDDAAMAARLYKKS